jgi:hypothetical protein
MIKLNWSRFEECNPNKEDAFQQMCTLLVKRILKIGVLDVHESYNQPGIETEPIVKGKKRIGFQCKYCNNRAHLLCETNKSIDKALDKDKNYRLSEYWLFTELNLSTNVGSQSKKNSIEKIRKRLLKQNIQLQIFSSPDIELEICDNPDLYWLFFQKKNALNILKDNISISDYEFLKSNKYLDLPIYNHSFKINRSIFL